MLNVSGQQRKEKKGGWRFYCCRKDSQAFDSRLGLHRRSRAGPQLRWGWRAGGHDVTVCFLTAGANQQVDQHQTVVILRWTQAPFVVRQLLLQHEDFGLQLVPLVEDVPQLLQGEPGPVGVLGVQAAPRLLVTQGLLNAEKETAWGRDSEATGEEEGEEEGRKRGYLGKILEHSRHVFIAHRLLVVNSETSGPVPIVPPSSPPLT